MKAGRTADCWAAPVALMMVGGLVSCLAAYSAAAMAVLLDNSRAAKKEQLLAAY